MSDDKHQQDLATRINNYRRSGKFDNSYIISGQPLIWMVEALLSDA